MATVLKICWGKWENASRDKRELSVYRDLKHSVLVLAAGNVNDYGRDDIVDTYLIKRYTVKPWGNKVPKKINQVLSFFYWAQYTRKLGPDVISGHDLTGWIIGWLSALFKRKKPVLIYDAHEYELGRNADRNKIYNKLIYLMEKFCLQKSALSIVVNESIADEMTRIYHLQQRPTVVRSTPDNWIIDKIECEKKRNEMIQAFHQPDVRFVLMYHGAIMKRRGIERLLDTLTFLEKDIGLIILGNGPSEYIEELKHKSNNLGISDRVSFMAAVPLHELWKYTGAADVGMILISGEVKSYYMALPNKLFENIQSLTPVIVSEFPEMKKIVEKYKIGLACDPDNCDSICESINRMRQDIEFYSMCKDNLQLAKEELCWEKEKQILIKEAQKIMSYEGQ